MSVPTGCILELEVLLFLERIESIFILLDIILQISYVLGVLTGGILLLINAIYQVVQLSFNCGIRRIIKQEDVADYAS